MSTTEDRRYTDTAEERAAAREAGVEALAQMILDDIAPMRIQHEFDDRLLGDVSGKLRKTLALFDGEDRTGDGILRVRGLRRELATETAHEMFDVYLDICRERAEEEQ